MFTVTMTVEETQNKRLTLAVVAVLRETSKRDGGGTLEKEESRRGEMG